MSSLGDYAPGKTLKFCFLTANGDGAPTTLAGTPAISAYKDGGLTQSTAGITLTADFDGVTGLNLVAIDTSADGTFYSAGSDFDVVITTGTVGGSSAVGYVVGHLSLHHVAALRPTTADRTLDVSAGGEAGVDWANVGSPTTVVGLSGTTVKTATDVETDTADIQTRLPAALVGGKMDSDATAISGDIAAADNLEREYDGTGYGQVLQRTTIATLATQISFTLTAGSADNDAYNGCIVVIEDATTAAQKAVAVVADYVGATKTVTLLTDPAVFTMAVGDLVTVIADRALKPTVDNRTLDVTATGAAGIDWANVENPTTALNLSATNIDVDQIVASVSGAVGSVTGAVGSVGAGGIAASTFAAGAVDAAAIATGAIDADALAADAGTELGTAVWATSTRALTDKAGFALSAAGIQAIWDALTSALTTVSSIGKLVVDNINATISSRATPAQVNTEADTALADVGVTTTVTGRIDAAVSTRATPAQVNAEMVDALATDTYAEPGQGAPAATTTIAAKINYLYKAFRNRQTQTATEGKLFADDGTTVDSKRVVSDDGTTTDRQEWVSGP